MNNRNDWHTIPAEEAAKRLNVNPYRGLSEKEIRRRRAKYGKNHIWEVRRIETGTVLLQSAGDLSTVLLIITAVLAFLFEEGAGAVTMCVILLIGALLRIITTVKAKRIFEENAAENIPTAAVLRDSTVLLISSVLLVPGDIVLLQSGDTVPCDGRVISAGEALVSETGITENKEHVTKYNTVITTAPGSAAIPCESRPNILYAGSTILKGDIRILVTATGDETLICMKQGSIEIPTADSLPLIEKLNSRCRISELLMLAFVFIISAVSLLTTNNAGLDKVFFGAVSMAAASMSEYLTAIGHIIIAITQRNTVTSRKEGRCGAVIKDCAGLERIAAADCVIIGHISLLKSGTISFHSFFTKGSLHRGTELREKKDEMLSLLTLASEAAGTRTENNALSTASIVQDVLPEREQMIRRATELFTEQTGKQVESKHLIIDRMPGSAAMAAGIDTAIVQPGLAMESAYVAALSDVRRILECCTHCRTREGDVPLTEEMRRTIFTETARLEYIGAKVLAVATRPSPFLTLTKITTLLTGMCFVGFFALAEQPAEGAKELVTRLREAQMRIILLSDNPDHDLYYGHDLRLFDKRTKIVSYNDLTEAYKHEKSLIVTVPPYVNTDTPQDLSTSAIRMKAVKAVGGKTAVFLTKDALDAGALGTVGCGIAVSRSGRKPVPQALKNKAQVIAYPHEAEDHGGFTEGINALREARRSLLNITNAADFLIASQLARLVSILISVLLGVPMLSSTAILIGGLLFDFSAVLAIAFEKAPANILSIPCSPLPDGRKRLRIPAAAGLLPGLLTVSMPLLVNFLAPLLHVHPMTEKESVTLLAAALFLCQPILAIRFMKRGPLFRRGMGLNPPILCVSAAVLLFSVLILFERHMASVIGGSSVPWYGALFCLIPAAVLLLTSEITVRILNRRKNKKKK